MAPRLTYAEGWCCIPSFMMPLPSSCLVMCERQCLSCGYAVTLRQLCSGSQFTQLTCAGGECDTAAMGPSGSWDAGIGSSPTCAQADPCRQWTAAPASGQQGICPHVHASSSFFVDREKDNSYIGEDSEEHLGEVVSVRVCWQSNITKDSQLNTLCK